MKEIKDFNNIDIRVGTIIKAEELENTEEEQDSSEPAIDPIMSKYASALTRFNK